MSINQEKIERIVNLMQTDDSVDTPQDAIKWSKNIFRTRRAELKKSLVEKIVAVLQLDLLPGKAAFGERSATASQVRQMLFRAGENAVDLRITENRNVLRIRGQILGEDFANSVVKIGDFITNADEFSEFDFDEIPKGIYDLIFQSGEREIVIEKLELK